ncbi:MAG: ATP-binding region ATPase domain protein [Mucilaginibacter sp.]|nr:ATP-binding region ATPase domain protein [Mucilaginibacter sp.]
MKKKILHYAFFSLILLLQTGRLFAQNSLVFKRINVDNGLAQNTAMSILQDKKGQIWIGTFDGLSKFNGIEFNTYKNDARTPKSLSSNQVFKLMEDRDDKLWIGTLNGINCYDNTTDQFIRYKLAGTSKKYSVLDIIQDKKGIIWAGTDAGLFNYDPRVQRSSNVFSKTNICNDKIQCLYIDHQDHLWIGTAQTLKIYDLKNGRLIPVPPVLKAQTKLSDVIIRSIIQDHEGNYWIATETEGLFFYNIKAQTCINYNKTNGLLSNTIRALIEIENREIWVGTKNGLNIISLADNHIKAYTHDPEYPTSLSQNSVRCILKDKEGNIWIGTYNGGVNVVYNQSDNFYNIGLKQGNNNGLSSGIVNTLMQDNDGSLWIGTDDGGLNHVDNTFTSNHVYYKDDERDKELLGNSIKAIVPYKDTTKLWVGTGSGLKIFDKKQHKFIGVNLINKPAVTGLIQNYVLLNDGAGLWVGTNFSGLYYIQNNKVVKHYLPNANSNNALSSANINCILRDGNYLWIGTKSSGLSCLNINNQTFQTYQFDEGKANSLTNSSILSIYKDAKNRLWIGTDGGGVNYLDRATKKFYAITEAVGIHSNTIHQIAEDNKGRLWISTNKGISSIGFKKFAVPFNANNLTIANYTVQDGLQSNQFITGAGIKTQKQQLIFGGINGITIFDPNNIKTNLVKPSVIFTDFLILNKSVQFGAKNSPLTKPINETSEITLPYNQAFFSIKFAALNYINPEKNQFAFKLEGFSDNEWHNVINQQMVTYTNLDPGTYLFKLKAANNDGIWNQTPRILKIIVLPPWYRTWYAYLGYAIIIFTLLYLFNNYSKKTERLKTQLEFESVSHLKDQELARKKLSFFINISHEIKTPLTLIMGPIERLAKMNQGNNKVQHQLMLMQRNSERLVKLINQMLDIRKFDSGNMQLEAVHEDAVLFLKEISLAFSGLSISKNINLIFKSEVNELLAWFDRDKLEKVIYNLLSNAIKFTPAYGTIVLMIKHETGENRDDLVITVEDNGCGIPPQNMGKLFKQFYHDDHDQANVRGTGLGLAFSKELVELHYGTITIDSRPENGAERGYTRVEVRLPMGKTHFKADEVADDFRSSEDITEYLLTEQPAHQQFSQRKAEILKNGTKEKITILLVEDNEEVLHFIKSGFEDDFEVYTATDGLEGWSLAKEHMPDLIISDVMMPKMDGIELCRNLKSDIDTSHIPVILLTARTPLIFKMEGLETGADDYVTKPFNFSILEARVFNLIEGRQKLRSRYQKEIMLEPQNIAISETDGHFLNKVLAFIEAHMGDETLNVEQLSDAVAMHRNTFTKKIKALTDQTAVEFIRSIKLKRASQLLSHGQLNVNEVAYSVGFSDVNHFRKCFKEQFGYTPKEQIVFNREHL